MKKITRDQLITRLVKAGELFVLGDEKGEVDSYFAFDDRSIKRGIIVAEGNYVT